MKTALVVDDNPGVRCLASVWLARAGYAVTTASTLAEARCQLAGGCDLLVVDVRLDGENGLHLATVARAGQLATRIVVISGWEDVVIRRHAEACGAVFVPKPLDCERFLQACDGKEQAVP